MGVISKLLGIVLVVGGGIMFFLGSSDQNMNIIYYFLGLTIMAMGFSLLTAGGKKEEKPNPPTVTEIACDNPECTFKEIRDFQKGDFILKSLETKCPKCQGSMTIQGVYMVREEEPVPTV
ncbi:MAG: hypothetical protein EAX81_02515 [Candidatus Thorarchaeota archaeon]|nr:hypothetical protein [Candidatus Thorarchaeota archaeon]